MVMEQFLSEQLVEIATVPFKPKAHSIVQGKPTSVKSGCSFLKGKNKETPAYGSGVTSFQNPVKGGGSYQTFSGNKFCKELMVKSKGKDWDLVCH